MYRNSAAIYHSIPSDIDQKIDICIQNACNRLDMKGEGHIFFRADDVAVPSKQFFRLTQLFCFYRMPLELSVVPAWLTRIRWEQVKKSGQKSPDLMCWHQHGWRHINHEKAGKKQEFGPNRSHDQIRKDIISGRDRLEELMKESFYPVFTPPWNRCSLTTLNLLKELGYYAVSRIKESRPPAPIGLVDFQTNVDLHTRKGINPSKDLDDLFTELSRAISSGTCGVMIHHQRMNDAAFSFLELFLKSVVKRKELIPVHFKDILASGAGG
ncbi:MAG: polysaccharide deacetylase family protein [Desulfobacterales bacterium]|nr:MAG: polysaccharide deacetylase family protein [Desulfobacterales bacterium]